jgi:hypothetical protein
MATQDLNELSCLGLAAGGTNRVSQKLFPVVIQYIHKVHGIRLKLIGLNGTPNEKPETIANCVTQH